MLYFIKEVLNILEKWIKYSQGSCLRNRKSFVSFLESNDTRMQFLKLVASVSIVIAATYFLQLYLITDQYTAKLSLWLDHVDGNTFGLSITNNSGVRVRLYFHECNELLFYRLKSQKEWRDNPSTPRCLAPRDLCRELNLIRPLKYLDEYSFFDFNSIYLEPYTSEHLTFVILNDNAECLIDIYPPDGYLVSFDSLYIDQDDYNKFNYEISEPLKINYYPAMWRYKFSITRLKGNQR